MKYHIRCGSRLHFGLLSLPMQAASSSRKWGGVGLMIDQPCLEIEANPSEVWYVEGPAEDRVRQFIHRCIEKSVPVDSTSALSFRIRRAPIPHHGLGSGTQVGLAVARILAEHFDWSDKSAEKCAERTGRGVRSGVGVHGFAKGGLLVDGGKRDQDKIAPLVARAVFPEAWRIVVILPAQPAGLSGEREKRAIAKLSADSDEIGSFDDMCRLVLLGMLPSLLEYDFDAFAESITAFNRRAGEMFRPVQGGVYAHPGAQEIISTFARFGIAGAGQSSWGPALFGIARDEEHAERVCIEVCRRLNLNEREIVIARAKNSGAAIQVIEDSPM